MKPLPVLIIDDDRDIRELLTILLRTRGFTEFKTAENGEEGIAILERAPEPHLVLVDMMMPVLNGGEFLQWLAEQPRGATDKVALMSAGTPKEEDLHGFPFFAKPFDFNRLFEFIHSLGHGNA